MNPSDSNQSRARRGLTPLSPIAAILASSLGSIFGGPSPFGDSSPFDFLFGGGPASRPDRPGVRISLGLPEVEYIPAGGVFTTLNAALEKAEEDEDNLAARVAQQRISATLALISLAQELASYKKGTFKTVIDAAPDSIEANLAKILEAAHEGSRHLLDQLFKSYNVEAEAREKAEEAQAEHEEVEREQAEREARALELEAQSATLRSEAAELRGAGGPGLASVAGAALIRASGTAHSTDSSGGGSGGGENPGSGGGDTGSSSSH